MDEKVRVTETEIEGVLILEPRVYTDERGYFMESYSRERYEAICGTTFVQDNESRSSYGVVRGLHYQRDPHAQAKLVRVILGRVRVVPGGLGEGGILRPERTIHLVRADLVEALAVKAALLPPHLAGCLQE